VSNSSPHISFAELVDLAEDRTPPDQRTAAEAHIASCSQCDENRRELAELISVVRADTSADAPSDIIAAAVGILRQRKS
jgi:hypothetical protein